jgi:hypothetical protein
VARVVLLPLELGIPGQVNDETMENAIRRQITEYEGHCNATQVPTGATLEHIQSGSSILMISWLSLPP